MYRFKLVQGIFVDNNSNKKYKAPAIVSSTSRLDQIFSGKFEMISDPKEPVEEEALEEPNPDLPKVEVVEEENRGTDVTEQYPVAAEAMLSVYRIEDGRFTIYDNDVEDWVTKSPIKKTSIKRIITQYLREE